MGAAVVRFYECYKSRGGCANLNSWDKWIFRATAA